MSNSSQPCPSSWNLITSPLRGCVPSTSDATCDSAIFPTNGQTYSRVCGRVNAYQQGSPDAFHLDAGTSSLEEAYVDGVSLTHGAAGSRKHIWTFAASVYETNNDYNPQWNCACTNTDKDWPYQVPSFVGNNSYFCDTGNAGPGFDLTTFYSDDPLWDGAGCGSTNACCQFNTPPWFCKTLPESTTDDLELRICRNQRSSDEEVVVGFVNIYIK